MLNILVKRNLLENVTIISSGGTLMCVILNYITNVSLLTGLWFPLYILVLFIVSVFGSFKFIRWLLSLNKPITSDIDNIVKEYPYLVFLKRFVREPAARKKVEWKEYDTNELSVISTVLERKLVSSWYVPYISEEISFPFACKQMLDQMIGKAFQICNNLDSKDVFVDIAMILTTHLKEYQKAVKRHQKSPDTPIESLYKKTHPISEDNKYTSIDHCTNILRVILKELIPWELWDTPHSELLVRILSKKLDHYIDNTLADPVWLNDKLITYMTGEDYVSKTEKTEVVDEKKESPIKTVPVEGKTEKVEPVVVETVKNIEDVKSSPVLRQRRGRQGRNEVKIYDRVIEGSVKTWETDMDLQCISVGQDLLASLDGELTLSRLWGHEEPETSPERARDNSPHTLWFGEEDMDLEPELNKKESPKPGDAILKDIQTTVNQAKHKIGDLQVRGVKHDEAAGMMEGLLDFGIAGLKKGLRFTGLSDDHQSFHNRDKEKSPSDELNKQIASMEHTIATQKDEIGNGMPHLIKQQRVTSQDSTLSQGRGVVYPGGGGGESPEPQYEEAADLSTSIAKLRCLLRQRAEAMPREEMWCEGAEETRGRTQQRPSSRPVDTASLADEYDMSLDRNTSPTQTSNNMQRLDKLFHRTVTGVFNSLKTAVGGEEEATPTLLPRPLNTEWAYVTTSMELSVSTAAGRLSCNLRGSRVEAALDTLQLHPPPPPPPPDDLEEWVLSFGRCCAAGGSCASAARLLHSHAAHCALLLTAADIIEDMIVTWLEQLCSWLKKEVFQFFHHMEEQPSHTQTQLRPFDIDKTVDMIVEKLPGVVLLFGSERVRRSVCVCVRSMSHAHMNREVMHRLLDAAALRVHSAAKVKHTSFDAN